MLRRPGHRLEKILFLSGLILMFSSIAFVLLHFIDAFFLFFSLGLYLEVALFTYGNLSMRRKSRNAEKEMDVVGVSPDQTYEALLSFFSRKHGYNKMEVLYSSKPTLIMVKLNSWIGMGRGLGRPPGSVKLQINPHEEGSRIQFRFDFSGYCIMCYVMGCILGSVIVGSMFGVVHWRHWTLLYPLSLGMSILGVIILAQMPFVSTLEAKTYLRRKIRECLTKRLQKGI